jgi:uncharacterized protein YndB with AHSA1/START domain
MVAPNTISPPEDRVLVLTREFDAPRELVFKAWSAPEHLANWFGPTDFTLPFCQIDFRVGGNYRLCMRSPDGKEYWVHGVYREILEPERLSFTWERDGADDPHAGHTLVTITLKDRGGGKTLLTLHQATFDTTEIRDGHAGGWTECFARLAEYVEELRTERTGS